jgi:hypothetical protein
MFVFGLIGTNDIRILNETNICVKRYKNFARILATDDKK